MQMKNNHEIIEKIKSILAEQLNRSVTSLHELESFLDNGLDEFDVIELGMSVEDYFDISLESDLAAGMTIVGLAEMVAYNKNKSKK